MGVNGLVCQGWALGRASTGLQNSPTNRGLVSTPLANKLLSLAPVLRNYPWAQVETDIHVSGLDYAEDSVPLSRNPMPD